MTVNIEQLKQQLEQEKATLEKDLSEVARKNPENPSDWETKPDEGVDLEFRDEVADFLEEREEEEATEANLEERLKSVELALKKIEEGRYGICEVGQEPIEEDRLAANPAARTCKKHLNEDQNLPRA